MLKRRNPSPSKMTRSEALQYLGLDAGPSERQVKSAYRAAAKRHHPDYGGDAEMFKRVTEAYEILNGSLAPAPEPSAWSPPRPAPTPARPSRPASRPYNTVTGTSLDTALREVMDIAELYPMRTWSSVMIRVESRRGPYEVNLEHLLFDAGSGRDILSGPALPPPRSAWDEE